MDVTEGVQDALWHQAWHLTSSPRWTSKSTLLRSWPSGSRCVVIVMTTLNEMQQSPGEFSCSGVSVMLRRPTNYCYCCLSGGLAAEEPGQLVAWRPCWCHADAEEATAEHAHLHSRSAQKHEMETSGFAGLTATHIIIISTHVLCPDSVRLRYLCCV